MEYIYIYIYIHLIKTTNINHKPTLPLSCIGVIMHLYELYPHTLIRSQLGIIQHLPVFIVKYEKYFTFLSFYLENVDRSFNIESMEKISKDEELFNWECFMKTDIVLQNENILFVFNMECYFRSQIFKCYRSQMTQWQFQML